MVDTTIVTGNQNLTQSKLNFGKIFDFLSLLRASFGGSVFGKIGKQAKLFHFKSKLFQFAKHSRTTINCIGSILEDQNQRSVDGIGTKTNIC